MKSRKEVNDSLSKLTEKALIDIKSMQQPVVQVCGPISTGGSNEYENKKKLKLAMKYVQDNYKECVFNQLKYEDLFDDALGPKTNKYDYPLLENFYRPIIKSGLIKKMYFIGDWENSIGSRWEHNLAEKEQIKIIYLNSIKIKP